MFTISQNILKIDLPNVKATHMLGKKLASLIFDERVQKSGLQVHLKGEIGTGKTTLTRSFLRTCGIRGNVKSPSYTILETYEINNINILHLDFYRFQDSRRFTDSEFRDLFDKDSVIIVEWPERVGTKLPLPDFTIYLEYSHLGRNATLKAETSRGIEWLKAIAFPTL